MLWEATYLIGMTFYNCQWYLLCLVSKFTFYHLLHYLFTVWIKLVLDLIILQFRNDNNILIELYQNKCETVRACAKMIRFRVFRFGVLWIIVNIMIKVFQILLQCGVSAVELTWTAYIVLIIWLLFPTKWCIRTARTVSVPG